MMDGRRRPRTIVRRVTTVSMVALATFATLATSQVQPALEDAAEGSFVLSDERPGFAARFMFEANAAALTDFERVVVKVEHAEYWSPAVRAGSLEPEVRRIDGGTEPNWEGLRCFGVGCLGTYEIAFRWPTDVDASVVRVEWTVGIHVRYPEMPDDVARVDAEIISVSDAGNPPVRFFEEYVVLGHGEPGVAQHVEIQSAGPIGAPIAIERQAWRSPRDAPSPIFTVFAPGAAPFRLRPATSKVLPLPDRCLNATCSFTFTVTISAQSSAPARVPWGLASRDVTGLSAEKYRVGSVDP
jgi:hypothetical protein